MYIWSRRDVMTVECLDGITGYAQVPVVLRFLKDFELPDDGFD